MPVGRMSPSIAQEIRSGSRPRICISDCTVGSPRFIGPFTIERQINEVTFLLQLPARYRIHPAFHVSILKPFSLPLSRHRITDSTTSSQSSRGTLHLPSTRDLGLLSTGRPLGISDRLGGLRAGGKNVCCEWV